MTPTEHYREAERLLQYADDVAARVTPDQQRNAVLASQVHATLATAHMTAGVWGEPVPERCSERGCGQMAGHDGRH